MIKIISSYKSKCKTPIPNIIAVTSAVWEVSHAEIETRVNKAAYTGGEGGCAGRQRHELRATRIDEQAAVLTLTMLRMNYSNSSSNVECRV